MVVVVTPCLRTAVNSLLAPSASNSREGRSSSVQPMAEEHTIFKNTIEFEFATLLSTLSIIQSSLLSETEKLDFEKFVNVNDFLEIENILNDDNLLDDIRFLVL